MERKIKNIFFDFGKTLVGHPAEDAGLEIVRKTGLKDENDVRFVRNAVFSVGKYLNDLDEGSLPREEYKKLISEEVPEHLRKYALAASDYHITQLPPIEGMEELLKKLKKDGYKIYITSNLDVYHVKQMYETEFIKLFDGVIFSSEIKARKPYREFFDAAIKKFGVKAEECLFIDDLEENVQGAKDCGIEGLVFKGDAKEAEEFIYGKK